MGSSIYVGLALTSHRAGVLAGAVFDEVTVTRQPTSESGRPTAPDEQDGTEGDKPEREPAAPAPSTSAKGTLRLVHWNVRHGGRRTDGVVDRDAVLRSIAGEGEGGR